MPDLRADPVGKQFTPSNHEQLITYSSGRKGTITDF
jgi:hypothetical protein